MGVPIANEFITPMGRIHLDYAPYCNVSCNNFEPYALKTCKTDDNGKIILDEHGESITTGITISCSHRGLCGYVARSLATRLKGETENDQN